jgi:titin
VRAHRNVGLGAAATGVTAPSNLVAIPASSSRIDLDWVDNSGNETRFEVQRDTTSSFASPQTFTLPADSVKFADTTLAPGTTYYYRVRAANATDTSGWSNTSNASTIGVPSGYAGAVSADSPVSHWRLGETTGTIAADQKGANPGTYLNGPGLGAASLLAADSANRAVAFDGLDDNVSVPNSSGLGLTTAVSLEAWVKPNVLPATGGFASVITKPEAYSLQFNGPRLEFTIMQNGTRQRLQAPVGAVVAGQTYHVVGTFDGTTRRLYLNGAEVANGALSGGASTTTTGLFIGSWDGFSEFLNGAIDEAAVYGSALPAARVSAHYQAGSSAGSSPVAAPSGLSATAVSGSQINLSWTDNSTNETSFVVERDVSASFAAPTTFTVAANATTFSNPGLPAGSTYYYRVKAVNATDTSAYSNSANATTQNPVAAPSGLSATAASSTRIDLAWTDNSANETSFLVERDTSAAFASPTATTVAANATSFSDTGLTPGTTYYYRVKGRNTTDTSPPSNTASAATSNPIPAPSGLAATAVSGSQVNLAWTDNSSNETGFVVQRDTSAAFASPTATTLAANATSYSSTGLTPGVTYYYRVKATNATDASA